MKTQSTHALTAKAIRKELKAAFPGITFSVTSQSFAGGNSVHVEWTNGPITKEVSKITGKFEYGHFDGMNDCYEYTNCREDIPQVKYVQNRRNVSEDIMQTLFEKYRKHYAGWENLTFLDECCHKLKEKWHAWTPREFIDREVVKMDLTNGLA